MMRVVLVIATVPFKILIAFAAEILTKVCIIGFIVLYIMISAYYTVRDKCFI